MKKYVLLGLIFLGLVILTGVIIFQGCDFNLLLTSIKKTNPVYLFLAFMAVWGFVFCGSLFLYRILHHFGYETTFFHSLGYFLTEIYFSAITPSYVGGQPVQMYEMKKDGIPYEASSVIVLFYSMFNRISLIFWATIFFILGFKTIFSLNKIYVWLVILGYLTTLMVIGFFALVIYSPKVSTLVQKISNYFIKKLKFIKNKDAAQAKVATMLANYAACANITKNNKKLLWEAAIILPCQRLSLLLAAFMVYKAFGLNEYSLILVLGFQTAVTLGSDLMPTPGGVFFNESLLVVVNNLLNGSALALSGMLLLRTFNFYLLVFLSGIFYLCFHFRKSRA